ncbi:methyl-accepting chemotaxis protein [Geopsychrobacter electrodiphilus]|uniref:methyl-accepting chemotaxis protein n=1 Tax=Geopsychrobacter electrodiphilus TaxID=225196 RepID=UPI0003644051|nr:methyl-accepting chemotaxis protein [Geopsychrobacter electrodiphilus]
MSTQTKGWRIRSKLLAMVMLLVLVSIGVGAVAYYGFNQANMSLTEMHENLVPELATVDELAYSVASARRFEKELFLFSSLGGDEQFVKKQQGYYTELNDEYKHTAKVIESLHNADISAVFKNNPDRVELEGMLTKVQEDFTTVQNSLKPLLKELMSGKSFLDVTREYGLYKGNVHNLEQKIKIMRENVLAKLEAQKSNSAHFSGRLTTIILATGLGAVLFGIFAGLFVSNRITVPLKYLMVGIESVGKGDIVEVQAPSRDEFAEIARVFNETVGRLKKYIQTDEQRLKTEENVINFLEVVSDASDGDLTVRAPVTEDAFGSIADAYNLMIESLAGLLKETTKDAKEVGDESRNLNDIFLRMKKGAESQLQYVTEATDSAGETAEAASEIAVKTALAQNTSEKVDQATNVGSSQIAKNIEGMQLIRVTVQVINKKMKSLSERLLEIGTISQLISDVATRTTILAMNASIEASRAGEQGRGFLVISNEIKRLADESSDATREIGGIIKAIQSEANDVTSALEEETSTVEQQTRLAQETGTALEEIEKATQQSKQLINEITGLSKNQHRVSDDMVISIRKMADITAQTSSLVTEASQISEGLNGVSEKLLESLSQFILSKDEPVASNEIVPRGIA